MEILSKSEISEMSDAKLERYYYCTLQFKLPENFREFLTDKKVPFVDKKDIVILFNDLIHSHNREKHLSPLEDCECYILASGVAGVKINLTGAARYVKRYKSVYQEI